jgi:small-conductance mechanosensitive channel
MDPNKTFQGGQKPWQQKGRPLEGLTGSEIKDDFERLKQTLENKVWSKTGRMELKKSVLSQSAFWMTFFILLGVALFLLNKGRLFLKGVLEKIVPDQFPVRHLSLFMIQHSLVLAGVTLFVFLYFSASPTVSVLGVLRFFVSVLMVVLFTKWAGYFTRYGLLEHNWIQAGDATCLLAMLTGVRYGGVLYAGMIGLTDAGSALPSVMRVLMEGLLFTWILYFWKNFYKNISVPKKKITRRDTAILFICKTVSYGIIGGGIVMDLLGYGSFSMYWYTSWGKSLVIASWGGLFFLLLYEWWQQLKITAADVDITGGSAGQPFKWFALQLLWFAGFGVLAVMLIVAWGGRQTVIINIVEALNYPISIGETHFSTMNLIKAVIVLILTHTLTRVWRFVLREKLLAESGLNTGLQDSITTISVYAIWIFGIMLSLYTFGMGTTTLAFGFGALGIGLGFGLQNIFNNFISGIILLFERPIQVGDDVEVNGVWATVKKINVRATVVQTYDNASIIIPNSEFISSQVTNWSFKDKRLRRNIDVGVAYGSDIEAVREILLDIANNTKHVFKQPKPEVLFRDFGDSALVFRLRVWTDIDNMLKIETAIRFEIDKRFREKGIVIAFPQRDVHLFTENAVSNA